jgi:histone deacetylase 1/2
MILQDLHITLSIALHLWCDNISAIALAFNSVFHSCTKHIKTYYHLIKEKVVNHDIQVNYISMQDQIANNLVF